MNPRIKLDRQALMRLLDGAPIQVPTEVGMLEFEAVQNEWQPLQKLDEAPEHMRAAHREGGLPDEFDVWSNDIYEVIVMDYDGVVHLSIKRWDRAPVHNWRHLQQIKNEICGDHWEAIELYPDEDRLADCANQTHLFASPERIPVGFPGGFVTSDEQEEAFNEGRKKGVHRGRQEPRQPGLTTGQTLAGKADHPMLAVDSEE